MNYRFLAGRKQRKTVASTTTTTTPLPNLKTYLVPRTYTNSAYTALLIALGLFAAAVCIYNAGLGNATLTIAALIAVIAFAVGAWSVWTQKMWRYTYLTALHGIGVGIGIVMLLIWLVGFVNLANGYDEVIAAGGGLNAILAFLPEIPADSLPLADALLMILINAGLLYSLSGLQKQEAELREGQQRITGAEEFIQRFWQNSSARIGGFITIALLLITYTMPRVDPYTGITVLRDGDLSNRLRPPECLIGWLRVTQGLDEWTGEGAVPSTPFGFPCDHPFGHDKNGRDLQRRVFHGVSVSLAVSLITVAISSGVGVFIGLSAGYLGGWWDSFSMRIMDVLLAFPAILLAIAIVAVRGPGLANAMLAIGIVGIPGYARLARSMAISIREQDYVLAANSIGAGRLAILWRYILPNSLAPLIVQSTLSLGTAVISAAALGFLGLGQQPPFPELGSMLAESRDVMTSGKWWVMLFPGLMVMVIVLGFNLLGDALRDTLDPKLRGR